MSAAPDHIAFYHPAEEGERPRTLDCWFTEDTVPNVPIRGLAEAMHVVLKHTQEWWGADCDEDLFVRYCCLVADLGYRVDEEDFYTLVDEYREEMTPAYAERWNALLRDYLAPHVEGP